MRSQVTQVQQAMRICLMSLHECRQMLVMQLHQVPLLFLMNLHPLRNSEKLLREAIEQG